MTHLFYVMYVTRGCRMSFVFYVMYEELGDPSTFV
jgi:hypothetical protein